MSKYTTAGHISSQRQAPDAKAAPTAHTTHASTGEGSPLIKKARLVMLGGSGQLSSPLPLAEDHARTLQVRGAATPRCYMEVVTTTTTPMCIDVDPGPRVLRDGQSRTRHALVHSYRLFDS